MRTLHFPLDLIREYYAADFGADLRRYFNVKPSIGHRDIAFIAHLDWHFNPDRKCSGSPARRYSLIDYRNMMFSGGRDFPKVEKETEKNFIFAGLFYFMVLVPQTLLKMFGKEVEFDFYRCTGWPLISAGLGGYLPPKQMLEEADLYPREVECENFHRMLDVVVPFMLDELRRFFTGEDGRNLNKDAYNRMLKTMDGRIEDFLLETKSESTRFADSLVSPVDKA